MYVEQLAKQVVQYVHHCGCTSAHKRKYLCWHVILQRFYLFRYQFIPSWKREILILLFSLCDLKNHLVLIFVIFLNETIKEHRTLPLVACRLVKKAN